MMILKIVYLSGYCLWNAWSVWKCVWNVWKYVGMAVQLRTNLIRFRFDLIRFRQGASPLQTQRLRYSKQPLDGFTSPFCDNSNESEIYFLLVRPKYKTLTEKYVHAKFDNRPFAFNRLWQKKMQIQDSLFHLHCIFRRP